MIIHGKQYNVSEDEFKPSYVQLTPMKPHQDVAEFDREIVFIKELSIFSDTFTNIGNSHDLYVPKNLNNCYKNIIVNPEQIPENSILRIEVLTNVSTIYVNPVVILPVKMFIHPYTSFNFINKYVYIHENILEQFKKHFITHIKLDELLYNNLINLLIMVKNAGDNFKNVLEANIPFVDKITILDTGSTDNTINIINTVFKTHNIKGTLYQRPWKNFKDSRNELFELAGEDCVFNVMLDDTYILNGDIRNFLTIARSDDEADSYSIFIKDDFMMYSSNRITKSSRKLKYIYKLHEIIEPNKNFEIPSNITHITDNTNPYMINRTKQRKNDDLRVLFEELESEPDNPRHLYYIAETYLCLDEHKLAYEYYEKRSLVVGTGYNQEIQDSLYKMAVIAHFNFNLEWDKCLTLFLNCFNYDTSRAEALYIIGYHYVKTNNQTKAYEYLAKAFEVSKNYSTSSMNYKYKINSYELPKLLLHLCLTFFNYKLGLECATKCNNFPEKESNISSWLSIFYLCAESEKYNNMFINKKLYKNKKMICFVAPGGCDKWDGETLKTKRLGGTETCIIRFAEELANIHSDLYNVIVVCNCDKTNLTEPKLYNNVTYVNLYDFPQFVSEYKIDICFVNRYPEYIQVCTQNNIEKIYLVLHDLLRDNEIIPLSNNFKNIICLTEWHKKHVVQYFPSLENKTSVMSYAVDTFKFPENKIKPFSFIFPSFPNRGLLQMLQIFPEILKKYPQATLNVFCDTKMDWVQKNFKEQMNLIDELLKQPNVTNHGWVSESVLQKYWSETHVLFYPCVFRETYCRVVLEAAASKTLVVTNDLAALNETVGNRGVIIPGDANTDEWKKRALSALFNVLDNPFICDGYVQKNYQWALLNKNYKKVISDFSNLYITNS
jgi:glycosyltransferase involved in cell wall biosynthesis